MVATKNQAAGILLMLAVTVFLPGCSPPGERALLKGKKYLDQGHAEEAMQQFTRATELMQTNAMAWNYLGLARHSAGQITNAVAAYQRAVTLDRNQLDARFNLGCLWLEQDNLEAAKSEFTTYTLRRPNDIEGWLKLGSTQWRSLDVTGAEKSFRDALRLATNNVDAMNGLALVQVQRKRPRDAAQLLNGALKIKPDFRPALLNLAAIHHQHLNERDEALRLYHVYLELQPRAADWDAVATIAQSLEPTAVKAVARPRPATTPTNTAPAVATSPSRPPITSSNRPATAARVETPGQPATKPLATNTTQTAPPPQVVRVDPQPVIAVQEVAPTPQPVAQPIPTPSTQQIEIVGEPPKQPAKRGLLSKVFGKREPKQATTPTVTSANASPTDGSSASVSSSTGTTARSTDRYNYLSPATPAKGNRAAAERAMAQGQRAYQSRRLTEAMQAFRQAHQLDPSLFENQYMMGMAAYEARSYKLALAAWENALAIRPESSDARYGFALTLKAAGYPADSANELGKLVASHPEEARAHLTLGNLYAEQLGDKSRARIHYNNVLQLDPRNPQAMEIRYWLRDNPP